MINALTNRPYSGENADILMSSGFEDPRFLTFAQARRLGRRIKKGSKGIGLRRIVEVTKQNPKTNRLEKVKRPRFFTVFNWTQTEG